MELTRSLVRAKAREYLEAEPLSDVERMHLEMLPHTFAGGEYGRRDVEWVVQWYYRRFLGAYPDAERRTAEEAFRRNDFEAVLEALAACVETDDTAERLTRLTALDGVDVPVASAFLAFAFPDRYVVVGEREWTVLHRAGELPDPYPDPPPVRAYLTFDGVCRALVDRFDVDPWTLYRALWRLGADRDESESG